MEYVLIAFSGLFNTENKLFRRPTASQTTDANQFLLKAINQSLFSDSGGGSQVCAAIVRY